MTCRGRQLIREPGSPQDTGWEPRWLNFPDKSCLRIDYLVAVVHPHRPRRSPKKDTPGLGVRAKITSEKGLSKDLSARKCRSVIASLKLQLRSSN